MKLGVHVGYWGMGLTREDQLAIVQEAERLGYDSVWTAEAYGSDAATVLTGKRTGGWWFFLTDQASRTSLRKIRRDYVNAMAVDEDDDEPDDDDDDEA